MSKGDAWIRVKSVSELRPGMTVEDRPCGRCAKRHRAILLRPAKAGDRLDNGNALRPCDECGSCGFMTTFTCDHLPRGFAPRARCFCLAIPEGRLFRLTPDATHETTNTRVRERAAAEGNRR